MVTMPNVVMMKTINILFPFQSQDEVDNDESKKSVEAFSLPLWLLNIFRLVLLLSIYLRALKLDLVFCLLAFFSGFRIQFTQRDGVKNKRGELFFVLFHFRPLSTDWKPRARHTRNKEAKRSKKERDRPRNRENGKREREREKEKKGEISNPLHLFFVHTVYREFQWTERNKISWMK